MPYPIVPAHRIAYNLDGTQVGYNTTGVFGDGVTVWATQTEKDNFNKENFTVVSATTTSSSNISVKRAIYFFFTELKDIKGFLFRNYKTGGSIYGTPSFSFSIQGSADSTDGINGIWETPTLPDGNPYVISQDTSFWRVNFKNVKFTQPIKVLRISFSLGSGGASSGGATEGSYVYGALAIYGNPVPMAGGNYLSVLKMDDTIKNELLEFGDIYAGQSAVQSIKLRNDGVQTATNISLTLGGQDAAEFSLSLDGVTYASVQSIPSLAPGASQAIYIKDIKPAGNVGPKQAVLLANPGSWS